MAIKTDAQLRAIAQIIRTETAAEANTAERVGGLIEDIVDSKNNLEYANLASFPVTGAFGKTYIATDTNLTYRWYGSGYVELGRTIDANPIDGSPNPVSSNGVFDALKLLSAGILSIPSYSFTYPFSVPTISMAPVLCNFNTAEDFSDNFVQLYTTGLDAEPFFDNTLYYLTANYNAGDPMLQLFSDFSIVNHSTIVLLANVFSENGVLRIFFANTYGRGLSNKINERIIHTNTYGYESGLVLSEYGTRNIAITSGVIWYGVKNLNLLSIASATGTNEANFYYKTSGVWQNPTSVTQYNNTQYNNGTNLVTLSSGKYAVNWIYRSLSETNKLSCILLGSGDYTLSDALSASPPSDVPTVISAITVLIGRIIVLKSASSATQIDSAFKVNFQGSGGSVGGGGGSIDATPTDGSTNAVSSNGVFDALATKTDANTAITGATKTKITYDAKGLVTSGTDATTADIADSSNKRYVTDDNLTVIGNTSGTNTGNQTTITGNAGTATSLTGGLGGQVPYQSAANTTAMLANGTAGQVLTSAGTTLAPTWSTPAPAALADNSQTAKTTPIDADTLTGWDSVGGVLAKFTFANIKTWIGANITVISNIFRIKDNTDNTKQGSFDLTAVTSGTTRSLKFADRNIDIANISVDNISITINGGGGVVASGVYGGFIKIPYLCTITGWNVTEGTSTPISTTCVFDVWKKSTFYPTVTDTIFGTKPSLTAATNNSATGLNIAVAVGDYITWKVDSNNNAKILTLQLTVIK